jgi:small conductance mechanosensitive channel
MQTYSISQKVIENAIDQLLEFGINIVIAILILIIGMKIASYLTKIVKRIFERSSLDDSIASFLLSFVRIGLKVIVIFIAAYKLKLVGTQFAAIIASAGVAIGLALQGSLSNIAGGCLILLLKPFQVGDFIHEDSHGNEGTVVAIDLFYTRIQTIDNKVVVVPNGVISNTSLTNVTRQDERLLDIRIGIHYDDDILLAKKILYDVAVENSQTLNEDQIQVFVDDLADSSVTMGLKVWVPTEEYQPTRRALLEKIKLEFDRQGIRIPYNQMDVHIINEEMKNI